MNASSRPASALLVVGIVTILLLIPHHIFYDRTTIITRTLLLLGIIWLPMVMLSSREAIRGVWPLSCDAVTIALSGAVGLTVWLVAWWLMGWAADEVLFPTFGPYTPPAIYQPDHWDAIWTPLILADVVILPLALMILVWGMLPTHMVRFPTWHNILIAGSLFGVLGSILFGQGIAGFLGYGLCGSVAAFVTLQTRTAWAGLVSHATFMYANYALLDDLRDALALHNAEGRVFSLAGYGSMEWLALVLLAGLVTVILLQVIRFRHISEDRPTPNQRLQWRDWLGLALSSAAMVVLIFSEITRRRL